MQKKRKNVKKRERGKGDLTQKRVTHCEKKEKEICLIEKKGQSTNEDKGGLNETNALEEKAAKIQTDLRQEGGERITRATFHGRGEDENKKHKRSKKKGKESSRPLPTNC